MKYLLICLMVLIFGCSTTKENFNVIDNNEFSLKNELNQSIIDGFFNNDTTGISNNFYFLN
jgi:hypothetical protein